MSKSEKTIEITITRRKEINSSSENSPAKRKGIIPSLKNDELLIRRVKPQKGITFYDLGYYKSGDGYADWTVNFARTIEMIANSNDYDIRGQNLPSEHAQLLALIMQTPIEDWKKTFYKIPENCGLYNYGFVGGADDNLYAVTTAEPTYFPKGKLVFPEEFKTGQTLIFVCNRDFGKNGELTLRGNNKKKVTKTFDYNADAETDFKIFGNENVYVLPSICETFCEAHFDFDNDRHQYLTGNAQTLRRKDFAVESGAYFRTNTLKQYERLNPSDTLPKAEVLNYIAYLKSVTANVQVIQANYNPSSGVYDTTVTGGSVFPESTDATLLSLRGQTTAYNDDIEHSLSLVIERGGEFFYVWD